MKPSNLLTFFFFLHAILTACSPATRKTDPVVGKIDSLFQTVPDFSGVLLLADKGKVTYFRAVGLRNVERSIPLDTADIFELASISKQFTAMIIMMLQEKHLLNFNDTVTKYIPDLPYQGITIQNLLTHTSGLPDYQGVMDEHWDKTKVASNTDNIKYLIQYHPPRLFAPGEQYAYSNTGYMLLATIAEIASGEDFIALCRNLIFGPLHMTSTDFRTAEEKKEIENFALGYLYVDEKQRYIRADSFPEFNYTIWLGNRKGPGRISSTASDLLRWDRALYSGKLVGNDNLEKAFSPVMLPSGRLSLYGFGWVISQDPVLGKVVSHSGDNPGYKTEIIRFLDADKTIILLNNNAHEKKMEIISGLRKIVSG